MGCSYKVCDQLFVLAFSCLYTSTHCYICQSRAGAVGTTTAGSLGHVVYVEAVNGDGTITISEMNYAGEYSQRTRVASASEFSYIY